MGFTVETMRFEGPLDLMLHLIREQELDIFDLDMEVLTDQYIKYLHEMEKLELEVESEYLVELATLIEYKSKKLLPKPADDLSDDYEEDPKDRLVKRLLEYQKYKEVSAVLYGAYIDRQDQLSKPISYDEVIKNSVADDQKLEGNPYDLLKAMNKVLRRLQLSKPFEIKLTAREISTEDRILQIKSRLIDLPEVFSFETLIADCESLHEYIVTFLAILDMAKDHFLVFTVDDNDEIWFRRGSEHD
ncbi:MAG: segregation/condensation protein A [Erysipelotrichaceae bacterium]|nr:segregation/condensation protein A [Erysipelotrichaceae bacterium]